MGEKMTPTLDSKLRCLQSLLQQMGAIVACKTVGEARDALLTAHLTQPAQAVGEEALEPHQRRVVEEKAELDSRLEKLSLFKHSRTFASLPIIEQERMNTHGHLMCALSGVLGERIAAFATALPNANGKEGCQHEWEQVTERGKFCVHCGQIITHATFEYVPPHKDTPDAAR